MTFLPITDIRTDGGTQSRVQLDWIAVNEYAAAMREGAQFPPVVVFHDGAEYWLADGFHRVRAAEHAELDTIAVDVRQGTRRDAVLYSVGANSSHGVRRTNADKRAAVLLLLGDEEWRGKGLNWIARQCCVSWDTASRVEKEWLSSRIEKIERPVTRQVIRNGVTYAMNTAGIGRSNGSAPAPVVEDDEPEPFPFADPPPPDDDEDERPEPDCDWTPEDDAGLFGNDRRVLIEDEYGTTEVVHLQPDEELQVVKRPADPPLPIPVAEALPVAIYNADAQQIHALGLAPVHLVVTSPPYNVGIDYDLHADDLTTYFELIESVWRQCFAALVDGGRIAVVVPFGVGRNPWVPLAAKVMDTLTAAGFTLRGQIIWDKNTSGNRTSWGSFRMATDPSLRDTTEAVIVAHKGVSKLDVPAEHKGHDEKGTFTPFLADGDYFMELAQDHWIVAPESAQRVKHPAPFPVELVKRLIHFYAFPGAHVLDPFAGSGTTGVAARECGCRASLVELSASYCEIMEARCR